MFFVYVDEIKTSFVIGGASNIGGAKSLAEDRAGRKLEWEPAEKGINSVVDFSTFSHTYRIERGER